MFFSKLLFHFLLAALLWIASPVFAEDVGVPQALNLPEGFSAKAIYPVPREQGSWVSMTTDPKGRLIVSAQYGTRLYRITLDSDGGEPKVEELTAKIGRAQGLLCAFDSLYVVAHAGDKMPAGLYRCRDTNGDDQYDEVKLLRKFSGGSEHGPHNVILSPDGTSLYVCGGNMSQTSPDTFRTPQVWAEDQVIEKMAEPSGHANQIKAPAGWVCKTDPDGKSFELVCNGFRNEYDIAFAPNGELFTWDADMEYDVGLPWYRPTRVCHVVSGGEFGWRSGSGKWPKYYPDSLPPVHEVGLGSPTGVAFGTGAKFPAKYQNSLFIGGWSYGRIYALHLKPDGATWSAEKEVFCWAKALPVTDLTINPVNGKMYFLIGGRRSQSALYEVSYEGADSLEPQPFPAANELVKLRRELETSHVADSDFPIDRLVENLGHEDRFIRYAARVGLEHRAVGDWFDKVSQDTRPQALLEIGVAIARVGNDAQRVKITEAFESLSWKSLSRLQRLALLRVYGLMMIRGDEATNLVGARAARKLDAYFPCDNEELNWELSKCLVAAGSESSPAKTLELLLQSQTQESQVAYAWHLASAKTGWTMESREKYFNWFLNSTEYLGGRSYGGYVKSIRDLAVKNLPENAKSELSELLAKEPKKVDPYAGLEAREKVRHWTIDDLLPISEKELDPQSRDLANGKQMFGIASCYKCHRMAGQGGLIGPDLTAAGNRFGTRDLLETMIDPSRSISDQYEATIFEVDDGRTVVGRVVNMGRNQYWIQPDMINPDRLEKVDIDAIEAMKPSKVSPMPEGLLDTLSREDILDLIAWMRSEKKP